MANSKNLKVPTSEEAREYGRRGGIASGKTRALRKTFKEDLLSMLDDHNQQSAILEALIKQCKNGNIRAMEFLRDTIGEKPIDRQEVKEVTSEWFK